MLVWVPPVPFIAIAAKAISSAFIHVLRTRAVTGFQSRTLLNYTCTVLVHNNEPLLLRILEQHIRY